VIQVTASEKLSGVQIIHMDYQEDYRGAYIETYNKQIYTEHGIDIEFLQDDISVSHTHVLRGLHGDDRTWKLISCLSGSFYLVVVDCREENTFGKWEGFTLSSMNRMQILVPPKFGNGHLVLKPNTIFHYKQSTYYHGADHQFTYRWDDTRFGIYWPIQNPILSERDSMIQ
jgi:dTDP-4-dehydrorhamnose 3,5-epimerase